MIVVDITSKLTQVISGYTLCFESAAMENMLISAPIGLLTVYKHRNKVEVNADNIEIYVNDFSDFLENCFEIRQGLWVTNAERTICELIKYKREEAFIYEALENYDGNLNNLIDTSLKYGVTQELNNYLNNI